MQKYDMLIVNGHGSNRPLLEMAARLTVVERPDVHCAYTSWWDLQDVRTAFNAVRESDVTSHACEIETSVYLAVDASRVRMDRAARDATYQMSPHFWGDLVGRKPDPSFKNPVWMTEYWSVDTANGVKGDPTKATREKGERVIERGGDALAASRFATTQDFQRLIAGQGITEVAEVDAGNDLLRRHVAQ